MVFLVSALQIDFKGKSSMSRPLKILILIAELFAIALGVAVIVLGVYWVVMESKWTSYEKLDAEQAFTNGNLGIKTAPVKYLLVMQELSGEYFDRRMGGSSDWINSYGFISRPEGAGKQACLENAPEVLPYGMTVSKRLPGSAMPSPVAFGSLTCAVCHSTRLETVDGKNKGIIPGAGSAHLDIVAWGDAFKNAVLDPSLNAKRILDTYEKQCGSDSETPRFVEEFLVGAWLNGVRDVARADSAKYGLPFDSSVLSNSQNIRTGPGRTQPFRSIVRVALDLPGHANVAISKIPAVFEQTDALRPRSQFDGSITNRLTRSLVAAYVSGSDVQSLAQPEIVGNMHNVTAYIEQVGRASGVPTYEKLFPEAPINKQQALRGQQIYMQYCNDCHGYLPLGEQVWNIEGAKWVKTLSPIAPPSNTSSEFLPNVQLASPSVGTDPWRLYFRYADMVPVSVNIAFPGDQSLHRQQNDWLNNKIKQAVDAKNQGAKADLWIRLKGHLADRQRFYPLGHPLRFDVDALLVDKGYINSPIPLTYLRAPYLHNASIPNLKQLINLEPRPQIFCRGNNRYDPMAVGWHAPEVADNAACRGDTPFAFDTRLQGNGNTGHDYPWTYAEVAANPAYQVQLLDLLEYLKTL